MPHLRVNSSVVVDSSANTSYHKVIETAFCETLSKKDDIPDGGIAVVYDKNPMEAEGICDLNF